MTFEHKRLIVWSACFDLLYVSIPLAILCFFSVFTEKPLVGLLSCPDWMALSIVIYGEIVRDATDFFHKRDWVSVEEKKAGLVYGILGVALSSGLVCYSYANGFGFESKAPAAVLITQSTLFTGGLAGSLYLKCLRRYREVTESASNA